MEVGNRSWKRKEKDYCALNAGTGTVLDLHRGRHAVAAELIKVILRPRNTILSSGSVQ